MAICGLPLEHRMATRVSFRNCVLAAAQEESQYELCTRYICIILIILKLRSHTLTLNTSAERDIHHHHRHHYYDFFHVLKIKRI